MAIHSDWYGIPFLGSQPCLVILMLADLFLHIFLVRVFVIREKELKASYQKQRDNHITSLKPFWSVFDIDDRKLMYIDGRVGTLVFMKHGYVYGRHPKHRDTHFTGLTYFIGELSLKGYEIRHFNIAVVDPNTIGLDKIQANMGDIRNTPLYSYQTALYNYVRDVCKQVSTVEYEYYLVIGNTMSHILNLEEDVRMAMGQLRGTLMTDIKLADTKEIYRFLQQYYNITYADVRKLMSSQVYGDKRKLITVLENYYSELEKPAPKPVQKPAPKPAPVQDDFLAQLLAAEKEADATALYVMGKVLLDEESQPEQEAKTADSIHMSLEKTKNVVEQSAGLAIRDSQVSMAVQPSSITQNVDISVSLAKTAESNSIQGLEDVDEEDVLD